MLYSACISDYSYTLKFKVGRNFMDIFSIFTLCGGLAFFLYGISTMSDGLEKIAGGKMEKLLEQWIGLWG